MLKPLNPAVIERQQELRQGFLADKPFRHVVIDEFLERGFCQRLLDDFPAFDEQRAINENGQVGGKAHHEKVTRLGESYRALDALARSRGFLDLISTITAIDDLKYDRDYLGGGTHENRHGQDLDPHVDFNFHPRTQYHRRLNLILYLNHDWPAEWGGALDLHKNPYLPPGEDTIKRVAPDFNRCVIFETTEHSWHGFERIELPADQRHRSRKSFALYYYTAERPPAEIGSPHATIYVDRPLPEIGVGEPLSEETLQRVRLLVARRDQHLKRLYGQVSQLSEQLNYVYASRSWRMTRPLRGLMRWLTRGIKR